MKEVINLRLKAWNEEQYNYATGLLIKGYKWKEIAQVMNDKYHHPTVTGDIVRNRLARVGITRKSVKDPNFNLYTYDDFPSDDKDVTHEEEAQLPNTKHGRVETEVSHLFTEKKNLSSDEILDMAGLDPKGFILKQVKGSKWSVVSTKNGRMWNYSTGIIAVPVDVNFQDAADYVTEHIKPFAKPEVIPKDVMAKNYLAVPLFDAHFGSSTFETYKDALEQELDYVEDKYFKKIVLILGGDTLHVDSVNSTTTKGTQLDSTNVREMLDDALKYIEPLIEGLWEATDELQIMSVSGNHDYTLSYMFARILQAEFGNYDNITWDIDLYDHYKATTLGQNFIGITHGDKGKKNYVSIFASQFAPLWASTTNRELFTGHLHNELDKDLGGIFQRQCSTLKPADQWTRDLGVVSRNTLTLVEYKEDRTSSVIYVG